jgi:hypothetical protein
MKRLSALLAITMLVTVCAATLGTAHAADAPQGWHDTGTNYLNKSGGYCFDGAQPNVIMSTNADPNWETVGTNSYNLATGQVSHSDAAFDYCNEYNGFTYKFDYNQNKAVRYSKAEPQGIPIEHIPTALATDGSQQVYSLTIKPTFSNSNNLRFGSIFASDDGGISWVERGQQFDEHVMKLVTTGADGRSIYALVVDRIAEAASQYGFTIYFSADAGVTWETRYHSPLLTFSQWLTFYQPSGNATPANLLQFDIGTGVQHSFVTNYISFDGAKTFSQLMTNNQPNYGLVFYTNNGLVRFTVSLQLESSRDNAQSWQPLPLPYALNGIYPQIFNMSSAPDNLFMSNSDGSGDLWYSPDAGKSWRKLGANMAGLAISPYAPYFMVGLKDKRLYTLDLSFAGKDLTTNAAAGNAYFFTETRHNLSPFFRQYWEANGGVAQFGYAKTEPFREVNPSDGKIYTVQYFERARFEYHPENKGTPYEVLLGLLGVQLTEPQRANGHGAFNRFEDMHYPGATYFPQTGHNLRNGFKAYWEANGGLSLYGYPISEEFYEVNPDDGKTYVVQYFERNRFEWHPENAGTRFEVLLGLLGNALLRQQGWS